MASGRTQARLRPSGRRRGAVASASKANTRGRAGKQARSTGRARSGRWASTRARAGEAEAGDGVSWEGGVKRQRELVCEAREKREALGERGGESDAPPRDRVGGGGVETGK
ncbi:hypothetical protein PAHAL_9G253400 [Panicum hallii]|uniref:Uncharacterized protein n=1 Tax=Panicum hallii TaxID=206008 RepID=A0A2T8I2I8_9POAL|nr:hypothetical protein PAHAL_9G253400 [Panicum hallii]